MKIFHRSASQPSKIKNFCWNVEWTCKSVKQYICDRFNPKQRWLTKKISRSWQDKPELIRDLLFEILVNYVESENGLHDIDYDWSEDLAAGYISQEYIDSTKRTDDIVRRCYTWIKKDRVELEDRMNKFPPVKEYSNLLDALESGDQTTCERIISVRQYLWT